MVYWTEITSPSISKASIQGGEPTTVIRSGNISLLYFILSLRQMGIKEAVTIRKMKLMCKMYPPNRSGQPRGYCHRPLGTNHVLDGLGEGSHWGGFFGRIPTSCHYWLGSRQPSRYHHWPSQWVGVVSHKALTRDLLVNKLPETYQLLRSNCLSLVRRYTFKGIAQHFWDYTYLLSCRDQ